MAKITIEELSESLKEYLNGSGLSEAQVQELIDNMQEEVIGNKEELATSNKTNIVGAINELFQSANNGKQLIADAIGEPLNAEDTFSAMSNDINGLLNTFKTNMMNNGVTVESSDKFKQLIDKLKRNVVFDATTDVMNLMGFRPFENDDYTASWTTTTGVDLDQPPLQGIEDNYLTIMRNSYVVEDWNNVGAYSNIRFDLTNYDKIRIKIDVKNTNFEIGFMNVNTDFISIIDKPYPAKLETINLGLNDGNIDVSNLSGEYNLVIRFSSEIAANTEFATLKYIELITIKVGEEDTTLRDSLASILEDEGVSVNDEDNMASLITKTDNEFAENTNKLYNLMLDSGYNVNNTMNMDRLLEILELNGISVSDIKQIACGDYHTFILKNDGSVWACGNNGNGQLGLGNTTNQTSFTQVTTNVNNDVKQISCGQYYTFILKNDGSVWSCGKNNYGQLGLGNTNDQSVFTQVTNNINNDVKQIACGYNHTFIIKNDGSVYSCGLNDRGQLGLGNTTNITSFTQVTTNINNDVKQIACGGYHTFILKTNGTVYSCGLNGAGQLGLGSGNRTAFTQVTTSINNGVRQIACGNNFTFILKIDGSIWSCGNNGNGQLGLGTSTNQSVFTQVTTNINSDVKQISCGYNFTMIIKNDGSVWSCGNNGNGQLGLGTSDTDTHATFTQVTNNINNDVKQIVCGQYYTFILNNDGSVYSCGRNDYGQLGLGNTTDQSIFNSIPKGFSY